MRQLLSGIAIAIERLLCHRDLKPENLLLADVTGDSNGIQENQNPPANHRGSASISANKGTVLKIADLALLLPVTRKSLDDATISLLLPASPH